MLIGVGLPATVPDTAGERITDWARRAERHGFSTLGVLDRLVYDNYDPLVALTAAAAVTHRIGLATTVLTAPYRNNTPLLAKQIASLDRIGGGRLTLGLAAGNRDDDFTASGVDPAVRGKLLDTMLAELRETWRGERPGAAVGPAPQGELPLILGGTSAAAFRRAAQYGRGWIAGGSSPSGYRANADRVEAAWRRHGRTGRPHLMTLLYFSLGPRADRLAQRYLTDYYAFSGRAESIVTMALTEPSRLRAAVTAYQDAGCDEIVFMPCDAGPCQLDRLADAVL
ncbi:LLM class flavin-dependent oxidoreductase [Streptomyces sp. NPDC048496]|uniref:LLM class flavin-dependent oxidoreductase n=1 Tax=Streptomyces sp. NPDC048496 TaxID=3365558 RepID=UPI00371D43DF